MNSMSEEASEIHELKCLSYYIHEYLRWFQNGYDIISLKKQRSIF